MEGRVNQLQSFLRKLRWAVYLIMAWLGLRVIRLLLRLLGYRKTVTLLLVLSPTPQRQGYKSVMPVTANGIARADKWWPSQPNGCLRRSLLFWWLFRWLGFKTEIRTGIRREGEGFELHAWVESSGFILNDKAGKVSGYSVLWSEISSAVIEDASKK